MKLDRATAVEAGQDFEERFVDADGFRIRYVEAGYGDALVCLHGAGGLRLSRAHDLLSEDQRVIVFELPGFGESPINDRSASVRDLAGTIHVALARLGLESFNLMGTSFGARVAIHMTFTDPKRVKALVLESPAAVLPEDHVRAPRSAGGNASLLYAHPERHPPRVLDPAVFEKQEALVGRLRGRDMYLEDHLVEIEAPTLVLFGTEDRMVPPSMGPIYVQKIPNCHLVLVYDAGHAIDVDRPEAFAGVVEDFLRRHERFIIGADSTLLNP